jgi:hypothetical protein
MTKSSNNTNRHKYRTVTPERLAEELAAREKGALPPERPAPVPTVAFSSEPRPATAQPKPGPVTPPRSNPRDPNRPPASASAFPKPIGTPAAQPEPELELELKSVPHADGRVTITDKELPDNAYPEQFGDRPSRRKGQFQLIWTTDGKIDGQDIITREPAIVVTPIVPGKALPTEPLIGVDQVLLADERTVYVCAVPDADCHYAASRIGAIIPHLKRHYSRAKPTTAPPTTTKTKEPGMIPGKPSATPSKTQAKTPSTEKSSDNAVFAACNRAFVQLERAVHAARDANDEVTKAFAKFNEALAAYMQSQMDKPEVVLDPEIIEKAKKFDALKGLMA